MEHYVALVHKQKGSLYGVSFPDFPGCIAAAESYAAVLEQAAEALAFHVEGMRQDGLDIPAPRSLEQIARSAARTKGDAAELKDAVIALVPLLPPPSEPQTISASLDKALLSAIDRYADAASMTRSAVLAEGAKLLMTVHPRPTGLRPTGLCEAAKPYRAQGARKRR